MAPSTSTPAAATRASRPTTWLPEHETFVNRHARNGEDAACILILFETEYPEIGAVTKAWIQERMEEGNKEGKKGK